MLHGLLVTLVLLALVCLPCVVAILLTADAMIYATGQRMHRARVRWVEHRLGVRAGLGRGLVSALIPARMASARATPVGPPIEQIAADLRRLGEQRIHLAARSPVWFTAVSSAYDNRLAVACQELEIQEHLHELAGVDLEIERVRVEGMLLAAGLRLGGHERTQP